MTQNLSDLRRRLDEATSQGTPIYPPGDTRNSIGQPLISLFDDVGPGDVWFPKCSDEDREWLEANLKATIEKVVDFDNGSEKGAAYLIGDRIVVIGEGSHVSGTFLSTSAATMGSKKAIKEFCNGFRDNDAGSNEW